MLNVRTLRVPAGVVMLAVLACAHPPYGISVTHADPAFMGHLGANEQGDAALRLMLDSLLVSRPRSYCFDGKYLAIRRQVVGPMVGCRAEIADTSVFYYTNPDGRLLVVARRFFVSPERLQAVGDSVYRHLDSVYGRADTCPPGPPDSAFQLHTRWIRDGYTLRFMVTPFSVERYSGYYIRDIRNVELQAWLGVSECEEIAGEPGGR